MVRPPMMTMATRARMSAYSAAEAPDSSLKYCMSLSMREKSFLSTAGHARKVRPAGRGTERLLFHETRVLLEAPERASPRFRRRHELTAGPRMSSLATAPLTLNALFYSCP